MPSKKSPKSKPKAKKPKRSIQPSLKRRINSFALSTDRLNKKLDETHTLFKNEIIQAKREIGKQINHALLETTDSNSKLEVRINEITQQFEDQLEAELRDNFSSLSSKISGLRFELEQTQQQLKKTTREVDILKGHLTSKSISTKLRFFEDQMDNYCETLKSFQSLLKELNQRYSTLFAIKLEQRLGEMDERLRQIPRIPPGDITNLRLRIESLEKMLGTSSILPKIKKIGDRLDLLDRQLVKKARDYLPQVDIRPPKVTAKAKPRKSK